MPPSSNGDGQDIPGRDFELDGSHAWVVRSNLDGGREISVVRTFDGLQTVMTSSIDTGFRDGVPIGVVFLDPLNGFVSIADPAAGAPADSGEAAVFQTSDGGATFVQVAEKGPAPIAFDDPLNGWGIGQGLFHTSDGARTWTRVTPPGWDYFEGPDPNGPGYQIITTSTARTVIKIYMATGMEAMVHYLATDDDGATWVDVGPPDTSEVNNTGPQSVLMAATAQDWFGIQQTFGDTSTLWTSRDGGATYSSRLLPFPALSIAMVSPTTGWVTTVDGLRRTTDGGATWTLVTNVFDPVRLEDGCVWQPSFAGHDGAGGTEFTWIDLTNTSTQTCAPPEVVGVPHDTPDGVGTFAATRADSVNGLSPTPASVGPNERVTLQLTTTGSTDACGMPSRPIKDVGLTLAPGGFSFMTRVSFPLAIETACRFEYSLGGPVS